MINAIEIHKLSNDHREIIRLSVREALKHIKEKHGADYMDELLEFNIKIAQLIKGIK
jgi:predicted small metal-binding protein